jgi:hypothetical protein
MRENVHVEIGTDRHTDRENERKKIDKKERIYERKTEESFESIVQWNVCNLIALIFTCDKGIFSSVYVVCNVSITCVNRNFFETKKRQFEEIYNLGCNGL